MMKNIQLNFKIIFIGVTFIDFILCFLFSIGISSSVIKVLFILFNLFLLFNFIYFYYKAKLFKYTFFSIFIIIFLFVLSYSFISFYFYNLTIFQIFKNFFQLLLPFFIFLYGGSFYLLGGDLNKVNNFIVKVVMFILIFGFLEMFILNFNFFYHFLNIHSYFKLVKGYSEVGNFPFHDGAIPRPEFAILGINHRLGSVFLEPLTAGIFMSSLLIYIFFNINMRFKNFLVILIFIFIILTQSRSALLMLLMFFILIVKKNLIISMILISLFLYFILKYNIIEFYLNSLNSLGGAGHEKGISQFIDSLFEIDKITGLGIGNIYIKENGYGYIYSQVGYLGLFLFLFFMIYLLLRFFITKKLSKKEKYVAISLIVGILIITNFHYYIFSYKSSFFIFFYLGYLFLKIKKNKESLV